MHDESLYDYLKECPTLTSKESRAALGETARRPVDEPREPKDPEALSRRIDEVAREIARRRPRSWRLAQGSNSSERLSPEVRAELEELFAAGDSPYLAAEKVGVSYRAARRTKQKRERRDGQYFCYVCRAWVTELPCPACVTSFVRDVLEGTRRAG